MEGCLIVDHVLGLDELFGRVLAHFSELGIAERWWELNYELNKLEDTNPSCGLRIILHPGIKEPLHIITGNDTRVRLLGVLESLNYSSH